MCLQEYEANRILTLDAGPKQNLMKLKEDLANNGPSVSTWAARAQITALLGSNQRTHNEFRCGIRAWLDFAKAIGFEKHEFPPTPEMLVQWSVLFRYGPNEHSCVFRFFRSSVADRCRGTFSNYVGHVKVFCQLLSLPTDAFYDDRVRRAKASIQKRSPFQAREKKFIRQDMIEKMLKLEFVDTDQCAMAMLFLACYVFLLRMPSEALPMVWGTESPGTYVLPSCALMLSCVFNAVRKCMRTSILLMVGWTIHLAKIEVKKE